MSTHHRIALVAAVAASLILGACSSTPVASTQSTKDNAPVNQAPAAPTAVAHADKSATDVKASALAPYLDPSNALYQKRSVYFDFDKFVVKPEDTSLVELHGKFLASHPEVAIRIEGNTDEQGGIEYNLALGQKRAEAVRKALAIYGVKPAQMEAVSFGEEKPKATGHDEAAHAQNRRADLAYPAH